ncbi:MAG TPA: HAMP domain-containing protein [Bacteroidales bacterium]|nr:HAMP domain-containing protein [Bacteroidales bacterium]HRZ76132.1 HAMP domain-containing protein [Bacteroidales bacterium]
MKNRLKLKILAGFGLLVAMLASAGAFSIFEFYRMSRSLNALIDDNYKTIVASRAMLEALEREDSGILMLMLGQWDEGRHIIGSADSAFMHAFIQAENNLTEPNEGAYVEKVRMSYRDYKTLWERPIAGTERQGDMLWYQHELHQAFLQTKAEVNALMELNQQSMYDEATLLEAKSKRAMMPGIMAILSAILFSIMFNFFISRYLVAPLREMSGALQRYNFQSPELKVNIRSNDEVRALADELNHLLRRMWDKLGLK